MRALVLLLIALTPVSSYAEVMDKEFSIITVLLWGLLGGLLAFFFARFKPRLLLILIPVVGVFFYLHLTELIDPYVGSAMKAEAGHLYVLISWTAPLLIIMCGCVGFVLRFRGK